MVNRLISAASRSFRRVVPDTGTHRLNHQDSVIKVGVFAPTLLYTAHTLAVLSVPPCWLASDAVSDTCALHCIAYETDCRQ